MWKKLKSDFKVSLYEKEDENYNYKIQSCITILLDKVVKKWEK